MRTTLAHSQQEGLDGFRTTREARGRHRRQPRHRQGDRHRTGTRGCRPRDHRARPGPPRFGSRRNRDRDGPAGSPVRLRRQGPRPRREDDRRCGRPTRRLADPGEQRLGARRLRYRGRAHRDHRRRGLPRRLRRQVHGCPALRPRGDSTSQGIGLGTHRQHQRSERTDRRQHERRGHGTGRSCT